jgi:NAD(P)-dependent dehydrogenase (short-subunit alcohol dehydrogenase family)
MVNMVVIVGCSQGFGKSLLEASFVNPVISADDGVVFILITTQKEKTISIWNDIYIRHRGVKFSDDKNPNLRVFVEEMDLSSSNYSLGFLEAINLIFSSVHTPIESMFLFLNSGSVTPVGPLLVPLASSFEKALMDHCSLNFISFTLIARVMVRLVIEHQFNKRSPKIRVVNVSSLGAVRPLYGLGVYSAIKAARDSLMCTLSLEMSHDFPCIDARFLSYAPGPMDTTLMRKELLSHHSARNELKESQIKLFVDPSMSAEKCVSLVTSTEKLCLWVNGAHLDYFDML